MSFIISSVGYFASNTTTLKIFNDNVQFNLSNTLLKSVFFPFFYFFCFEIKCNDLILPLFQNNTYFKILNISINIY